MNRMGIICTQPQLSIWLMWSCLLYSKEKLNLYATISEEEILLAIRSFQTITACYLFFIKVPQKQLLYLSLIIAIDRFFYHSVILIHLDAIIIAIILVHYCNHPGPSDFMLN